MALLIIDVQKGLFERSNPIYHADNLLDNITVLADRAGQAGAPVIAVQHTNESSLIEGSDAWQLHPRLGPIQADLIVHKRHGNAFQDTGLNQQLASRGIECVVITGLVTNGCVRATCLGARDLGYQVILASDGHSTFHKQAARLVDEWNQKLGDLGIKICQAERIKFV